MSTLRKVLSRAVLQGAKMNVAAVKGPSREVRLFSTLLEGKERSDEARYIRNLEAQRQAEIRAKVEQILALEDGHHEREALEDLLEKKPEDVSLIAKLGLDDWKFALPIGLFIAIPALSNEVLVLDAETQLVACFILFCSTMYTQVGGMLAKSLDDYSKEIYEDLKAVDNTMLEQINTVIAADELALSVEEDFKQYCHLTDQLAIAQAEVLNHKEIHLYNEAIVKKLESLSALEESAVQAIRHRMVAQVKRDVIDTFTSDKKVKDAALARAIEILASGAKGPLGKDVVGDVFSQSLANYKSAYAKLAPGADPILAQLEKDIAAVATAPVVESKGGNVYLM